jgi:hypothetical protein
MHANSTGIIVLNSTVVGVSTLLMCLGFSKLSGTAGSGNNSCHHRGPCWRKNYKAIVAQTCFVKGEVLGGCWASMR